MELEEKESMICVASKRLMFTFLIVVELTFLYIGVITHLLFSDPPLFLYFCRYASYISSHCFQKEKVLKHFLLLQQSSLIFMTQYLKRLQRPREKSCSHKKEWDLNSQPSTSHASDVTKQS